MVENQRDGFGNCKCCGEYKSIWKDGFCKSCYDYKIQKKYVLNPKVKNVRKDIPYDILNYINDKGVNVNAIEISEKFGISRARVYQILNRYFDIEYVKRETNQVITTNDVELKVLYDLSKDDIILFGNNTNFRINAQDLRNILLNDKNETM